MRVTGSRAYTRPTPTPKMPPGLVDLMEGLTKDVLKHNPEDVYEFCAEHMQKLLDIRDGTRPKKEISLEQKIKKAQEKIRQKIKYRRLQEEVTKHLNETLEQGKNITKIKPNMDISFETTGSSKQPVHQGVDMVMAHDEMEISLEPNVIIATTDTHNQEEVFEEREPVKTVRSADLNDVKKEAEEACVDVKEGLPIILDTLRNESLTNKLEEDLKRSSVVIIESEPVISLALQSDELVHEVKEEEKVLMVDITSLTLETPQNDEEIKNDVEIKENTSASNTKPHSDVEHVVNAQQNLNDDKETVIDPQVTLKHDLSLDSKETFKPNELIVDDIAKISSIDDVETAAVHSKAVDKEVTKNNSNGNAEISFEQQNETFDNEILSDKNKPTQTNGVDHEVKSIDKNAISVNNENTKHENYDEQIKSKESNIDTNHPESVLEYPVVKTIEGQHLSNNKNPEPETETEEPVQFDKEHKQSQGQENETEINDEILITHGNENLYQLNDLEHVIQNGFGIPENGGNIINTVVNLLDQERQFSSELMVKANDVIAETSSIINDKDKTKIESYESDKNQEVTGMDLETAAITIQKVFRTFMFSKSRASTLEDAVNENYLDEEIEKKDESEYVISSANLNKERRALGLSRMDTVLQTVNEEKSLSLSTDDSSTLSSAATTIQAHVRGFLVRNKLASYKTASGSSLVNSEGLSTVSLDGDTNEPKKTILNIHIVPERGQFISRDESMLTSIDLPLDNSPPSSVNLHPLGYDKSEPRKQLKREDAIQSVSPPSNNSGKLSEEVDFVKDTLIENSSDLKLECENAHTALTSNDNHQDFDAESCDTTLTISSTADTVIEAETYNAREVLSSPDHNSEAGIKATITNLSSDEMDVVTPFPNIVEKTVSLQEIVVDDKPKLVHTGEFHDIVVQTQVKRSESSVVREFKNVLVYFLLWDK